MAAYRVPYGPHVTRRVRRQTFAARAVGFVLLWSLVGLMGFVADRTIAPQHLMWKPLSVIDPVGAGPAEYAKVIDRENAAMARAGKVANLKAD